MYIYIHIYIYRRDVQVLRTRKSVTLSVATPMCHYQIADRRAYIFFT